MRSGVERRCGVLVTTAQLLNCITAGGESRRKFGAIPEVDRGYFPRGSLPGFRRSEQGSVHFAP